MIKTLKFLFILSSCFLSYLTFKIYQNKDSSYQANEDLRFEIEDKKTDEDYYLYSFVDDDVEEVQASKNEILKIKKMTKSNRQPASAKNKRTIIGKKYPVEDLSFKNTIDAEWKDKLADELLRFQKKETKTYIQEQESFIQVNKNKEALFVEKVIVTYFLAAGNQNSFNALIDSETGKIIKTWNRTINESAQLKFKVN